MGTTQRNLAVANLIAGALAGQGLGSPLPVQLTSGYPAPMALIGMSRQAHFRPNGMSQKKRRIRAKQAMSHSGRRKARIR